MKERKTTSIDIAYRAGVSQSTVSRALRDSPLVTKATRAKVQAIAREMNYRIDRHAASLRSHSSNTLALLIFEDPTSDDSNINPFFLSMLGNITRYAASQGYDLLVSFQQMDENWQAEYEESRRADGIILLGYGDYITYREKLEQLSKNEAHFIIWGPIQEGQPGQSLGCDNFLGGYEATRHLLASGRSKIAFIGDASERFPELLARYQGHSKALAEAGIETDPALHFDAEHTEADGAAATQLLLSRGVECDAVFCASDLIAIGVVTALKQNGRQVPEDVAVVGFDDIPAASYLNPQLTTVRQDTREASRLLVDNLIALINGEPVESAVIAPQLIVRESCGSTTG